VTHQLPTYLPNLTTNQCHGADSFLKNSSDQEIPHRVMELDSSLPYIQKPATFPNPQPDQYSSQTLYYF